MGKGYGHNAKLWLIWSSLMWYRASNIGFTSDLAILVHRTSWGSWERICPNSMIRSSHLHYFQLMIIFLFGRYPSLRVAYIDELEKPINDKSKKMNDKIYFSCLVKADLSKFDSSDPAQNLDQVKAHYSYLGVIL